MGRLHAGQTRDGTTSPSPPLTCALYAGFAAPFTTQAGRLRFNADKVSTNKAPNLRQAPCLSLSVHRALSCRSLRPFFLQFGSTSTVICRTQSQGQCRTFNSTQKHTFSTLLRPKTITLPCTESCITFRRQVTHKDCVCAASSTHRQSACKNEMSYKMRPATRSRCVK